MLFDPDAGHYVKKAEEFSVQSGTGYTDTCIVDRYFGLPVFWDAVSASKNDNTIFQDIVKQCIKSTLTARGNSVGNLKTEKRNNFRAQYIPRIFHKLVGKNLRISK